MNCSICNQKAFFKCNCSLVYLCKEHLPNHILTAGTHHIESLGVSSEEISRINRLKSKILEKIEQIEEVKKEITLKTFSLIEMINKEHNQAISKLEAASLELVSLLKENIFGNTELAKIDQIAVGRLRPQMLNIDGVVEEVKRLFSQNLEISSNFVKGKNYAEEFDAMNLKSRIEYFHPILWFNDLFFGNLNNCLKKINMLLVSSDCKFLFMYSGKSSKYLHIWDLDTKSYVEGWCAYKLTKNEWIRKYPECIPDTWRYEVKKVVFKSIGSFRQKS